MNEFCAICFHNVNFICQLKGEEIPDQFTTWCGLFKLQTHCVGCLLPIQDDDGVYSHPEGGRLCKLCSEDWE